MYRRHYTKQELWTLMESALQERARYLGLFFKHMSREDFDNYISKALFEYGELKRANTDGPYGEISTMVDALTQFDPISSCIDCSKVVEQSEDRAVLHMTGDCVLVKVWKEEMGFTDEEVAHICDVACNGDFGHADSLGLSLTFTHTMAHAGKPNCEAVITKKEIG